MNRPPYEISVNIELLEVFKSAMKSFGIKEMLDIVLDGLLKASKLFAEEEDIKDVEKIIKNTVQVWSKKIM